VSHELPYLGIYRHTLSLTRSYYGTVDPVRVVQLVSASAEPDPLDIRGACSNSKFVTLNLHDLQYPSVNSTLPFPLPTGSTNIAQALFKQGSNHDNHMFRLRTDLVDMFIPSDLQRMVHISVVYSIPDPAVRIFASTMYSNESPSAQKPLWLDFETMRWEQTPEVKPLSFVPTRESDVRILGYMVCASLNSPIARECLRILYNYNDKTIPRPGEGTACQTCYRQFICLGRQLASA
jgi:hypothetical protein